jgi:molybdopterin molybdotransferase
MVDPEIGYDRALAMILGALAPLPSVVKPLEDCEGSVLAEDVSARVDSPAVDSSMKDGYALRAADLAAADDTPCGLTVVGTVAAGEDHPRHLAPGTAWRILTGGALPRGADTIVAEEFTRINGQHLQVTRPTAKGRNIRRRGSDTAAGAILLRAGHRLAPGDIGLLAAAGHAAARVFAKPRVAVIATGDEVLRPGQPLSAGKVFASNLLTIHAWCRHHGISTTRDVVGDRTGAITRRLTQACREQDAIITSGGAWTGDKDLMAGVLADMGWQPIFHRLRLGPGKAAGFGFLDTKPVFLLPGGPPSNLVAFLLLTLPGLLRLSGYNRAERPSVQAELATPVSGMSHWTQAIFGDLIAADAVPVFRPHDRQISRLQSMARARGLLLIPEGREGFAAGDPVTVQLLR